MAHESPRPATLPGEHEAVVEARKRLEARRSALGDRHPEYAAGLDQLALSLIMHGDPDEAEPLLRQSLEIRKHALGENHADYATNLSSLAGLLWARSDLDGAEPLLRQALDIRWDLLGIDHPKTVAIMNSLEQLLETQRDLAGHEQGFEATTDPAGIVDPSDTDTSASSDSTDLGDEPGAEPGPEVETPAVLPESPVLAGLRGMSIAWGSNDLSHELTVLSDVFSDLGDRLIHAAGQLKAHGSPPPGALVEELSACHGDFVEIRDRMRELAEVLHVACPPDEDLRGLEDLAMLLDEIAEAEIRQAKNEEVRRRALSILDRVLRLSPTNGDDLPALRDCQERAGALHRAIAASSWTALPAVAELLAEGDHPFAHLLTLIVDRDDLSDDLWSSLHASVGATFGESLAEAAALSRLALPGETDDSARRSAG